MKHERWPLASDDCELLSLFERSGSIANVAEQLGKDESVITRQLTRIAGKAPVLEKHDRRWRLTAAGKQVISWYRASGDGLRTLLAQPPALTIASRREFGVRVLTPRLLELFPQIEGRITVVTSEGSIEPLLLKGEAELGFECGPPSDPAIAHKRLLEEPLCLVTSAKGARKPPLLEQLLSAAPVECACLPLSRVLPNLEHLPVRAHFTDLAAAREAVLAGLGWAVLPRYAVTRELERRELTEVPGLAFPSEAFGVWWLRERKSLRPWVNAAIEWMRRQRLDL